MAVLAIFSQIFPFFALMAIGAFAARRGIITIAEVRAINKFIFFFALPAMLFRFGVNFDLAADFSWHFIAAYALASSTLYLGVTLIGYGRGVNKTRVSVEAQTAVFGNSGFMAIPIVLGLFGDAASGALLMVLAVDIIIFGNLMVVMIFITREGFHPRIVKVVLRGLLRNPMVMGMALGLGYSLTGLPLPAPVARSLMILGEAATPAALFVIGAGLGLQARPDIMNALGLALVKLVAHPALAAFLAFMVFRVEGMAAAIMVTVAAMPTASNLFIVASHYDAYAERVSEVIFVSTILSVLSLTLVIHWLGV